VYFGKRALAGTERLFGDLGYLPEPAWGPCATANTKERAGVQYCIGWMRERSPSAASLIAKDFREQCERDNVSGCRLFPSVLLISEFCPGGQRQRLTT